MAADGAVRATGGGGWLVWLLLPAVAAGGGWVGAQLAAKPFDRALETRPPTVVLDPGPALRAAEPEDVERIIADYRRVAERLANGGVLVLDAQAVLAAPKDMYVRPPARTRGEEAP